MKIAVCLEMRVEDGHVADWGVMRNLFEVEFSMLIQKRSESFTKDWIQRLLPDDAMVEKTC